MRYFINLTPFFAIGLAAFIKRVGLRITVPLIALAAGWSLLLIANMTYVIRRDVNPGFTALLADQVKAISYLPHLAQGFVVRALVLRPALHQAPDVAGGLILLSAEICAVTAAMAFAGWRRDRPAARQAVGAAGMPVPAR
jgi:hypothetical protein